jgi:hypothetical protein
VAGLRESSVSATEMMTKLVLNDVSGVSTARAEVSSETLLLAASLASRESPCNKKEVL